MLETLKSLPEGQLWALLISLLIGLMFADAFYHYHKGD